MSNLKLIVLSLVGVLIAACTTTTQSTESLLSIAQLGEAKSNGFIPVEPYNAQTTVKVNRNGTLRDVDLRLLSKSELLAQFNNTRSKITVSKVDSSGKLTYLTGSLTGEKGKYIAVMDFSNFFVDSLHDDQGNRIGDARVGIGLRLIANVETKKRGLDLGSILKIGLAASKNELNGSIEVRAIGITSQEILSLLPGILASIDESSIQSALEAMAAVKAKIYETDTTVGAQIVAVKLDDTFVNKKVTAEMLQPVTP